MNNFEPYLVWGLFAVLVVTDIPTMYFIHKNNPAKWRLVRLAFVIGVILPGIVLPAVGALPLELVLPPALLATIIITFFAYWLIPRTAKPDDNPYRRSG